MSDFKKMHTQEDPFADEPTVQVATDFEQMLHETDKKQGAKVFQRLRVGDKVKGKVISIGSDSVFLDVGQRSEATMALGEYADDPRSSLTPGTVLDLYISSLSNGIEVTRSLGKKDLSAESLREALSSGLPVEGKVTGENKGGYTVEIGGIKAFCPFSQIDTLSRQPSEQYIGKTFKFRVTQIKGRDAVVSRSALLREEQAEQRQTMLQSLAVGQTVTGKVTGIEAFGFFIDIGGGISALVPQSEYSWSRTISHRDAVRIGDDVRAKLLKIENPTADRPRISASTKQVEESPWDAQIDKVAVNATYEGTVTRLATFGAFVEILPGIDGLVHISEMSAKRRVHSPGEVVKVGDRVQVQVKMIDRVEKRIGLSIKALQDEVLDDETKQKYLQTPRGGAKNVQNDDEHRGVELVTQLAAGNGALADAFKRAQGKNSK